MPRVHLFDVGDQCRNSVTRASGGDETVLERREKRLTSGRELSRVTPAITFSRGEFTDRRPNPSQLATFKQQMHTCNPYEERPIADALYEGLKTAITASNHMWSDSIPGNVKVNLTFINLQVARNSGMVSVGATSSVQVKADFLSARTGEVVYSNIYAGSDERSKALVGLMGMVKDSIDASILRCVQSIVDDPGWRPRSGEYSHNARARGSVAFPRRP